METLGKRGLQLDTWESEIWSQKLRSNSFNRGNSASNLKPKGLYFPCGCQFSFVIMCTSYLKHISAVIPRTPSRSICSKFGHFLRKGSKSLSQIPRRAVKKSFRKLGQPFASEARLSTGKAKFKLKETNAELSFLNFFFMFSPLLLYYFSEGAVFKKRCLTTIQNRFPRADCNVPRLWLLFGSD